MHDVLVHQGDDGVLRLTLNRPSTLNAITLDMQRTIDDRLRAAAKDDAVRAVVLAGAGSRAFSSGYDITELTAVDQDDIARHLTERDELLWRYLTFPKPTVAAVAGVSRGAGTLYAACSDIRVGDPATSIAVTAVTYAGVGLTWLLGSLVGDAHARDLLMTARAVTGIDAAAIGLITRFTDDADHGALAVARQIAAQPPSGVQQVKALLHDERRRAGFDAESRANRSLAQSTTMADTFAGFAASRSS
ncbi:enoyl-CoA hydratase/isomerase family protein [Gordonia humi]|uniref:Enoyl-CoA hydratase/carnithine racemase n=1 Tax=Gordonia humi TaxID=686429 RepID=A0A840F696_9ACTN|nr:enoyl-CoA hydratase/isomerase family protein [Gordonia humi]MBB4137416.1 enoyl-CoA hydratase/carnithine racemase [Gordonia humi]